MGEIPNLLCYQGFVEKRCEETDGVYRSEPSGFDVAENVHRYSLPRPGSYPDSRVNRRSKRWVADWLTYQRVRRDAFGVWHHLSSCPYCQSALEHTYATPPDPNFEKFEKRVCANCGMWDAEASLPIVHNGESYSAVWVHRRSILKAFSVSDAKIPIADLTRHISRHPESLASVDPYKLEQLVGDVFSRTMNCEVAWLGGPGDGGIDLLLVRGDETFAVQVKRKADRSSRIPVSLVREFVGSLVLEGIPNGIFVTTSSFTYVAESTAIRAWHCPGIQRVDLVDGSRLSELCGLSIRSNSAAVAGDAFDADFTKHTEYGSKRFLDLSVP